MSGSAKAGTNAERHTLRAVGSEAVRFCALLPSARQESFFLLTMTYIDVGHPSIIVFDGYHRSKRWNDSIQTRALNMPTEPWK